MELHQIKIFSISKVCPVGVFLLSHDKTCPVWHKFVIYEGMMFSLNKGTKARRYICTTLVHIMMFRRILMRHAAHFYGLKVPIKMIEASHMSVAVRSFIRLCPLATSVSGDCNMVALSTQFLYFDPRHFGANPASL